MIRSIVLSVGIAVLLGPLSGCGEPVKEAAAKGEQAKKPAPKIEWVQVGKERWMVHDMNRPVPPVVTPGEPSCDGKVGTAPSDAVVLFDGKDASKWEGVKNPTGPFPWVVGDGYLETVKDAGYIRTKQKFGSCQLHIEFATPEKVIGKSQGRGNSGVFLMGRYEVQVLDSYDNRTYADGMVGALYGRAVPLANAAKKPGEWQTYDIVFHRPVFKGRKVVEEAEFTVFLNGVLIQNDVELTGATGWGGEHAATPYEAHGDKDSLSLQDHGNPVRFRNIWIRELKD